MKKIQIYFRFTFFILLIVVFSFAYHDTEVSARQIAPKFVLIINSYHQEYTWTREETQGIIDSLTDSGGNYNFTIENMDWKNYPTDQNLQMLYDYYKYKYQNKKVDLIITTDDAALTMALKYREEIFSNAPVIFCGVNEAGAATITKGYHNLTGVIEETDPAGTVRLALHINPELKNVYLLYDNTESGLSTGKDVVEQINKHFPKLNAISLNNLTFDAILSKVKNLDKDSVVMIVSYSSDKNHKIFDMNYVISEVNAASSVPVYHLYSYALDRGIIGGKLLSGVDEGASAVEVALRVLNGENPDQISFVIPKVTKNIMNYNQMKRFSIPIENLPKDCEIINKPFSFYETYKKLIYSVIAVIAGLLVFLIILLISISRINRMKKNLALNHEELTQLYEELTASDIEMRQQYEEIIEVNEKFRISEEKLTYLAYHDGLTGLPNKLSLNETAERLFIPGKGNAAVFFVDIDNFKNVNDTMGHELGDRLIIRVGEMLASILGESGFIFRLGGDEFIMILPYEDNNGELDIVQTAARKILNQFSQELILEDISLQVSVSIGIALYPEHGTNLEQLLKYADIAMYKVKSSGKTNYQIYNNILNELFTERANIDKFMPKGLENGEFEVYYQPQYDLKNRKVKGFEALLRWHSSQLGEVSPLKFIKVSEDNRYIITLGKWVLLRACEFLKKVHDSGYPDLTISVNVSVIQMEQNDFCDIVMQVLKSTGLDPRYLELEITETVLMESVDRILEVLDNLNQQNVKIVLDDFGKGYSSLSYLKQLPISTLKVDKVFIDGIVSEDDHSLTGQIVAFGKSMGMTIVAEGVETKEQFEYLRKYDCDMLQGYLFSRPKPEEDILQILNEDVKL